MTLRWCGIVSLAALTYGAASTTLGIPFHRAVIVGAVIGSILGFSLYEHDAGR